MNKSRDNGSARKMVKVAVNGQSDACFVNKAKLETSSCISVLPEEILERIFFDLDDSKDLEAVSNATPQFRRIVKPSMSVWAIDQIFPMIFSKLDKKDILNCRLVCRKWNSSVDSFVQNHPESRDMMPYPYHPTKNQTRAFDDHNFRRNHPDHRPAFPSNLFSKDMYGTLLYSRHKLAKLSNKMKSTTCNPFVTRSVSFSTAYDDEETYWQHALSFLDKYGKHIWHAVIGPHGICPLFNYQVLNNALCLMPNVRTLIVFGFEGEHCGGRNRLRRHILLNPLPSLAHLHTIEEMLPESRVGKWVVDEMLERYSGHLTSLITTVRIGVSPQSIALPHMTALTLNIYDNDDSYQLWGHLFHSSPAPHLAKLSLKVCTFQTVSISKLLKPLQKTLPSLAYLHVWFARFSSIRQNYRAARFLLGNVKTLEINDHPDLQFKHILSIFPMLEYVVVGHKPDEPIYCDVDDEREMEIRMLMRNRSMFRSDLMSGHGSKPSKNLRLPSMVTRGTLKMNSLWNDGLQERATTGLLASTFNSIRSISEDAYSDILDIHILEYNVVI